MQSQGYYRLFKLLLKAPAGVLGPVLSFAEPGVTPFALNRKESVEKTEEDYKEYRTRKQLLLQKVALLRNRKGLRFAYMPMNVQRSITLFTVLGYIGGTVISNINKIIS
jgi:hypothetical protein